MTICVCIFQALQKRIQSQLYRTPHLANCSVALDAVAFVVEYAYI